MGRLAYVRSPPHHTTPLLPHLFCTSVRDISYCVVNRTTQGSRFPNIQRSPLKDVLVTLGKHTPAHPGDRTIVDALVPLCDSVTSTKRNFEAVVEAAKKGAESTRGITARLGRASYVIADDRTIPDPGAWGQRLWWKGLSTAYSLLGIHKTPNWLRTM